METNRIKAARRGALLLMVAFFATILLSGCAAPTGRNPGGNRGGDQAGARGDCEEGGNRRVSSSRTKRKGRRQRQPEQETEDREASQEGRRGRTGREGSRDGQEGTREGGEGGQTASVPVPRERPPEAPPREPADVPLPPERPADLGREPSQEPRTGVDQTEGGPVAGPSRVAENEFPPTDAAPVDQA